MATIGFIIHAKNEEETVKFARTNSQLINKIVVTKTDSNKIESVFDKKIITMISAVNEKGDVAMATKVSKGDLAAVFYLNPQPEASAGLYELLQACIKKKIYFALNHETADCVLGRIATRTFKEGFKEHLCS